MKIKNKVIINNMLWMILLGLAQGAQQDTDNQLSLGNNKIEPAMPGSDYIAYACDTTDVDYIKEVCDICSSELAYSIPLANVNYLKGYYDSQKEIIQPVLEDFSSQIESAVAYGVAINSTKVCLSASSPEISSTSELLLYFANTTEIPIKIPEIFENAELTISYVSVRSQDSVYDYYSIDYTTDLNYTSTDTIILNLQRIYNPFLLGIGSYVYSGNTVLASDVIPFEIYTPYDRLEFQSFAVEIQVDQEYNTGDWSDLINSQAECSDISPPRGISSLSYFPTDKSTLEYYYASQTNLMVLAFEKIYFKCPDFAIAPYIELIDIEGDYVIQYSDNTCGYEIVGLWEYLDYNISLTVYDENTTLHMQANGVFITPQNISVAGIDQDFYNNLFHGTTPMIPDFVPVEPVVIKDLANQTIYSPRIQLYFEPDTSYNIYGPNSNQSYLEVLSGRIDDVVQTVLHLYTASEDHKQSGYEKIEDNIIYSSYDINTSSSFYMASMLQSDLNWTEGTTCSVYIDFNDNCGKNNFCALLKALTASDSLEVHGNVVNTTVDVSYPIESFYLTSSILFQEVGLSLEYRLLEFLPVFKGAFFLQTDNETVLRFEGSVSQDQDMASAILNSKSYDIWSSAYNIDSLTIAGIYLAGNLSSTGSLISSQSNGTGLIGTNCYQDNNFSSQCLQGIALMNISFDDYSKNGFDLEIYNLTTIEFYNTILGYDYTYTYQLNTSQSCLELPAGISIAYRFNGNYSLHGQVLFCGINGQASGTIDGIGAGTMNLTVALQDFYFASLNARMESSTGYLYVDRANDETISSIEGTIDIWSLNTLAVISISDYFYSVFSGAIYQGYYSYLIEIQGSGSNYINEALFNVTLSPDPSSVSSLESWVVQSISSWISEGTEVLQNSTSELSQITQRLGYLYSNVCDPDLVCPKSLYCNETIQTMCTDYPIVTGCAGGTGCSNVKLTCTSLEIVCIKANETCKRNCDCLSTIKVCLQWVSECVSNSTVCRDTYVTKDTSNCLSSINTCAKEEANEIECEYNCNYNNDIYQQAYKKYLEYLAGYNQTYKDLIGFEDLRELMKISLQADDLLNIKSISAVQQLNQSGIGPYDYVFSIDESLLSASSYGYQEYNQTIYWDFFDDVENQKEILSVTKTGFTQLSGGTIAQTLVIESPSEVLQKNIDKAKT